MKKTIILFLFALSFKAFPLADEAIKNPDVMPEYPGGIFLGGAVTSQTRQARANIAKLEQQYEARRREVAVQVRKEFQGVVEGKARIDAVLEAETAATVALDSNKKGVTAGTRNVLDVFNTEQQLASTRRDLAEARIQYILSRLRLQALTGSLTRSRSKP